VNRGQKPCESNFGERSYVKHVAPLECSKEGLKVEGQITLLLVCSIMVKK